MSSLNPADALPAPHEGSSFRSAHAQAMLTIMLLMLWCLLTLLAIGSQVAHLGITSDPEGSVRYLVILIAQMIVLAATTAAFSLWVYRAYRNLTIIQLSSPPKFTAGAAIEGFFVPGLNFYRPYDVLCQLWAGSSHSGSEVSLIPLSWWLAFWASWLVSLLGWIVSEAGPIGESQRTAWSIISQILWLATGLLGIVMIRKLDAMQKEKAQMVADLQSGPAVPVASATKRA